MSNEPVNYERRQGGHLDVTLGKILAEVENLKKDVSSLNEQVADLNDMKNKSIGAGFILAVVGSGVGWFLNVAVDKLYK